jgi:hypothetical protein
MELQPEEPFGAQLDPVPAAVSLFILLGAYAMRAKIDGASAARAQSEAAARALKAARVAAMSNTFEGDIALLEADVAACARRAEEARTISLAGLNLRFMVPLPLGAPAPGVDLRPPARTPTGRQGESGQAPDRAANGATLRQVSLALVLGIVVLSQSWLLTLFATDPMGGSEQSAASLLQQLSEKY